MNIQNNQTKKIRCENADILQVRECLTITSTTNAKFTSGKTKAMLQEIADHLIFSGETLSLEVFLIIDKEQLEISLATPTNGLKHSSLELS